ncbi:hypothetical protein BDN72DRAFT_906768 [Pluteus cervinus]|uniref:Uncharacterized protein n=1 Tax=Pluteus cervinus TaxID=181527 RepID=A0ACD2ZYJ3_9AGAR|nr:hypothetical protein BDN72DRAFT_906768 [Pluteus cervinus]
MSEVKRKRVSSDAPPRKKRIPAEAAVPRPSQIEVLPPIMEGCESHVPAEEQMDMFLQDAKKKVAQWARTVPVYRVHQLLEELAGRPRNAPEDKEKASENIKEMLTLKPDACSGVWGDQEGNILLCAFSLMIQPPDSLVCAKV